MNTNSAPNPTDSSRSIIDDDGAASEAVTLNVSIDGTAFDLVYNARDEAFDGSSRQIAAGIVNFADHHHCGYVLLLGKDCWVSANSGISFQAQIESNEIINQQYDSVVLPLDDSIYVAQLSDGFVTGEKVQPVEQAIEFLTQHQGSKAILAGGKMSQVLANENYSVNCEAKIYISGSEVSPYSFQPLNWLLLKNKLYHPRLLIPLAIVLAIVALVILIVIKLQAMQPEPLPEVQPVVPKVAVPAKTLRLPSNLKNSAGQLMQQVAPVLGGSGLDFFKTCRLKQITIANSHITYSGEKNGQY